MRNEEIVEQWLADSERLISLINSEFNSLNEEQLNYSVHIRHCNIRQIMQRLAKINALLIIAIERAIPEAKASGSTQEYKPRCIVKYFLNRDRFIQCNRRGTDRNQHYPGLQDESVFAILTGQQNKLKELIALCRPTDINKRLVPFGLFGLIRLSIGETLDYLFICQKSHCRLARNILMLQ
jgi:hypothetical protein